MGPDYHGVRLLHARRSLIAGLRRWGAYALAGALVLAAVSNAPLAIASGLLAATALPMWHLAAAGWAHPTPSTVGLVLQSSAVLLAYAGAAWVPVALSRRWWWPAAWAQQERAWPLPSAARRWSDAAMLPWFVAPVMAPVGLGLLVLAVQAPQAQRPHLVASLAWAGLGWLLATAGAFGLGWLWMQGVRAWSTRAARGVRGLRLTAVRAPWARPLAQVPWWRALVLSPLHRGAARGTARVLALGCLATPALGAGPLVHVQGTGPGLSALALVALLCTGLLAQRTQVEWATIRQAFRSWPLPERLLARALRLLTMLPTLLGAASAASALALTGARPLWAGLYLVGLLVACLLESGPAPADPSTRSARWLFSLALLVALAWEAAPP